MATRHKPDVLQLMAVAVLLALVALAIRTLDWPLVWQVLRQADWERLPLALGMMVCSLAALSYGFGISCRIFDIRAPWRDLLAVAFVSMSINHMVAAGGLVGYSLRVVVLRRHGVSGSDTLAVSAFNAYVGSLVFLAALPLGLGYFWWTQDLNPQQAMGIAVLLAGLALIFVGGTVVMLSHPLREWLLRRVARVVGWVRRGRGDGAKALVTFNAALTQGMAAARRHPDELALLLLVTVCDWLSAMLCLGACFLALGISVSLPVLLTGFVLSLSLGMISMIPGGLGIVEGSMAGIFYLFGIPLEQATLAGVLFRVIYYLTPFALSALFARRLAGGRKWMAANE